MTMQAPSDPRPTATPDDYSRTLLVDATPEAVVAAVTDDRLIRAWWTAATNAERHADHVELFARDHGKFVAFTIEHEPGTGDVTWLVTDCVMGDWVGTTPTFSVRPAGDGTTAVEFRHVGLRPALECFDQCRAGWNHFMPSLHQFLETGTGRPNEPRDPAI